MLKDKTFFLFAYEGLRLRLPQVVESLVPDVYARQHAVVAMQPYLNAFPLPSPNTLDDLTNEIGQFNASFSNSSTLDAYSMRIDHKLSNKLNLFGRYNFSPSKLIQRGGDSLNSITPSETTLQTATAGATWAISPTIANDLRFNYSRTHSKSFTYMDGFGGAVPLASLPFPNGIDARNGQFLLLWFSLFPSGGFSTGPQGNNLQRQINLVENLTTQKGAHNLKFGVDFRRLSPVYGNTAYLQEVIFNDVPSSLSGNFLFGDVASARNASFLFHNLGAFAQDTWRISPRLTITYGLRWDLDFAPSSNPAFLAVTGFNLNDLSQLALAPAGTPPFQTTYGNVAPRIGVAYQVRQSQSGQTVFRGGFGTFFDLATSEVGNAVVSTLYPFGTGSFLVGGTFPLSPTMAAPPPITSADLQVDGAGGIFDPHLKLPYTLQWNFAVEQALGVRQTLSMSYLGAAGRRLIQTAVVLNPSPTFSPTAQLVANASTSDYHALQVQFQRRLSRGLQALASYTWSHSIDTGSAGSAYGDAQNLLVPTAVRQNRGPSDFDIRNSFSAGVTYDIPVPKVNAFSNAILRGWSIENVVQARSATPVTVTSGRRPFRNFFQVAPRADVVAGQPLYLYGPQYPGGKALNPLAFVNAPSGRQGNLGRNSLRGFGAAQWDFSVHRDFPIRESIKLQFRAEMFNVLNHPNFGPPMSALNNKAQFGLSTMMLGQSLNSSNLGGGALSPLYQIGGPRSMQFALKLAF